MAGRRRIVVAVELGTLVAFSAFGAEAPPRPVAGNGARRPMIADGVKALTDVLDGCHWTVSSVDPSTGLADLPGLNASSPVGHRRSSLPKQEGRYNQPLMHTGER